MTSNHPGLTFRTLDPDDAPEELLDGYLQAFTRGFRQGRAPKETRDHWLTHVRADRVTLRGAWQDHTLGAGLLPVATFSSWESTINAGLEPIGAHLISDVTVSASHRRRGLLRHLMTVDLADAAAAGAPLAALTASEGSIYGRFGFGLATFTRHLEVDVTPGFALRDDALPDDGSVEMLEPAEAWPSVAAVFAEFHARTRGSVDRPQFYETRISATWDWENDAPDATMRAVLHLDRDGRPDGYALYKVEDGDPFNKVQVIDLATTSSAAYLGLWRFLAGIDLTQRVVFRNAPLEDPLPWAAVDPFRVRTTRVADFLWVRVLDVAAALEARPWGADGVAVIEVGDPLGHATGRWRVAVDGGRAEVTRTDASADVSLAADTLGALYLGGVSARTLAAAGRLAGDADAVAQWAAMCDTGPTAYCITGF